MSDCPACLRLPLGMTRAIVLAAHRGVRSTADRLANADVVLLQDSGCVTNETSLSDPTISPDGSSDRIEPLTPNGSFRLCVVRCSPPDELLNNQAVLIILFSPPSSVSHSRSHAFPR